MRKKNTNILARLLGNKRWQGISVPLFAVFCSLIVSAFLIFFVGANPLTAFRSLLQGAGVLPKGNYAAFQGQLSDLMETIDSMTPMLFASLAVAVAMKAGYFSIGVSGQMLFAGYVATVVVGYSEMNPWLAKPLVLLIGLLSGALIGGLIGFLKVRFNINEVVSAIMFNNIIQYVVGYFIMSNHIDPITRESRRIGANARLTLANVPFGPLKMRVPIVFVLGILVAVLLQFYINRTSGGFEIRAIGKNMKASSYAGIRVGRRTIWVMILSGAFAGLAGVTYYLGYYQSILPKTLANMGFDAIAVSLLGNNNPIGILFSSFLITVVSRGSSYMSSSAKVEQEIAALISGIILLFSACGGFMKYLAEKKMQESSALGGAREGEEL